MDLHQIDEQELITELLRVQGVAIDRGNDLIEKNLQIAALRSLLFEALDVLKDNVVIHARLKERIRSAMNGEV